MKMQVCRRFRSAGRRPETLRSGPTSWRWPLLLSATYAFASCPLASAQLARPEDIRAPLSKLRTSVESYVQQKRFGGFYDYQTPDQLLDTSTLDPANITLPAGSWPLERERGFGAFLESVKQIQAFCDRPGVKPGDRAVVFTALLKLFEDFPFVRYQAYCEPATGGLAPNNIFVQFMSRRLLFLAMAAQPRQDVPAERRLLANSLFPWTANGRAGASLLERHGLLLVGFGVRADIDPGLHRTPLSAQGWKSTKGPPHAGGLFDYGYFTDEYIAEVGNLLDLIPPHLISGDQPSKPFTTITCHGYNYLYEMEDFAQRYYPADADARSWLGYLNGQDLNVFGLQTIRFADGIGNLNFRVRPGTDGLQTSVLAHSALLTLVHEVTHYLHTTITHNRPDYADRLNRIIALGVRERSNIRAIDCDITNFAGSSQPAYTWLQQVPQEMVATAANVVSVDPLAVLNWCDTMSQGTHGVVGPLNHFLWFIDAHSLDTKFRETEASFLLTLQPTGRRFARIDCRVKRDTQGRIASLIIPGRQVVLAYDQDGFAHVATSQ